MNDVLATVTHRLNPRLVGFVASICLVLGSFGGGAIRYRGGILEAAGLSFLSYGHGAAISNTLVWLGIVVFALAWVLAAQQWLDAPDGLSKLRRALSWWIAPLLLAAPVLSRDVYSYLMQGAMLRDGFDPYTEGAAVNPGVYLLEVSHDWRNTTTPYGPLHLYIGELITRLVGDNVTAGVVAYKVISIAGFVGIAIAVPRLARLVGANPTFALWLGVANPLMILHMVAGMHNESVMVALVTFGLVATYQRRFFLGVALVAVAVSLKATAAIVLPFMVWMATWYSPAQASPAHRVKRWVLHGISGAIETIAIVAVITWVAGSNFGWISQISGNSKVINPLALPTLLAGVVSPVGDILSEDFAYNVPLGIFRTVSSVAMLVALAIAWWVFRGSPKSWQVANLQGIAVAYAAAFTFNAVTLPWYYASLITVVACVPRLGVALTRVSVAASLVITFAFTGSGNHQLYNIPWMIASILAAFFLSALALRRPLPELSALLRGRGAHATRPLGAREESHPR